MMIPFKVNRFITLLQSTDRSPTPSPTHNLFNIILFQLSEWLSVIPHFFSSLLAKFNEAFPPETRAHWLAVVTPYVVGGIIVVCFLCCCLPAIISCCTWVLVAVWSLIRGIFMLLFNMLKGVFMFLFNMLKGVFRFICCCGKRSVKMMKAPGRGGKVFMPRGAFESNPRSYFKGLRAGRRV